MAVWIPATAQAAAQDDCGTGGDAPNDWSVAIDVLLPCGGELVPQEGDGADWYRVGAVPGKGVRVTLDSPTGGVQLQVLDDAGNFWFNNFCCGGPEGGGPGPCCGPGTHAEAHVGAVGPAYRIGVSACCAGGPYSLFVEYVDLHGMRIEDVTITKRVVETDAGPTPASTQRMIEVTVTNLGPGISYASGIGAWAQHEFGGRNLGGMGLPALEPGASTTVRIPWDTTGEAGDVRIHVDVGGALIAGDREEQHAEVETFVLVGGTGTGADLLAHHVGRCDAQGCLNADTRWDAYEKGLIVQQNANDGSSNTYGHVGTHPGTAHVFLTHNNQDVGAFVVAGTDGNLQASVCPTNGDPCFV